MMSYDLRRLRHKGFIWRMPNSYRYQLTTYGCQVALLLSKLDSASSAIFAALDPAATFPFTLEGALESRTSLENILLDANISVAMALILVSFVKDSPYEDV